MKKLTTFLSLCLIGVNLFAVSPAEYNDFTDGKYISELGETSYSIEIKSENVVLDKALEDDFKFLTSGITTAEVNREYIADVIAMDILNPSDVVTITGEIMPTWLVFSDITNGRVRLAGTPTEDDLGDHPVKLKAVKDAVTIYQEFIITVSLEGTGEIFTESFENIPDNGDVYSDFSYEGDEGFVWAVVSGRTDQTMTTKALSLGEGEGEGSITSPTLSGGLNSFSFDFTNASSTIGTVQVFIGETKMYEGAVLDGATKTGKVTGIGAEGEYIMKIVASKETKIDNLAWSSLEPGVNLSLNKISVDRIKLYPNPTSDFINIETNIKLYSYEVLSVNGQFIKKGKLQNNSVGIKGLSSGSYLLVLKSKENIVTKSFIIN